MWYKEKKIKLILVASNIDKQQNKKKNRIANNTQNKNKKKRKRKGGKMIKKKEIYIWANVSLRVLFRSIGGDKKFSVKIFFL